MNELKNIKLKWQYIALGVVSSIIGIILAKRLDRGIRGIVFIIGGYGVLYFHKLHNIPQNIGLGILTVGLMEAIRGAFNSTAYITVNHCRHSIYYKPENGASPRELKPGKTLFIQGIDGLVTPYHKNEVIKTPDYMGVVIEQDGRVKPTTMFSKMLGNMNDYGAKDENWVSENPDWKPLFEKGKEIWGINQKQIPA